MMVRTWLAPDVFTVAGRAASEQTWIMFLPCFSGPHYRAGRLAGEGWRGRCSIVVLADPYAAAFSFCAPWLAAPFRSTFVVMGPCVRRDDGALPHSRGAKTSGWLMPFALVREG